jgi:sortase A
MNTNRGGRGPTLRWLEKGLLLLALLFIGAQVLAFLEAGAFRALHARRFESVGPGEGTGTVAPPEPGAAIGVIQVPRLGLSAVIAEGTDAQTLRRAVGHVEGTALPGEAGNVALAGHRDTFFRPLKDIAAADTIRVKTLEGVFDYVVDSTLVVDPDRSDLLESTGTARLTLVTCYPFRYIGPAPRRLVVQARPALDGPSRADARPRD